MVGFIINYNKLEVFKRCLKSLEPILEKIYIIDNASDYKPLLEYYEKIKSYKIQIIHNSPIKEPYHLEALRYYIEKYKYGDYYLVTDSDIELLYPELAIKAYVKILKKFERINCVGAQLKIDNIPDDYPAKDSVLAIHSYFYNTKPYKYDNIYYRVAKIDTTLAVYRTEEEWKRLEDMSIRCYYPFNALHLDWYITPQNMTEDQRYFLERSKNSKVSHWLGRYYRKSPYKYIPRTIWEVKGSPYDYKPVKILLK